MTVLFRTGRAGNGKVYYNVDCKKLRQLKREYKKAGWRVDDKGEQGTTYCYRLIEIRKENGYARPKTYLQ